MKYLMDTANKKNFAVPAPNIQNELTARAVIKAAERCSSPLIIDIAYPIHPDIDFLGRQTRILAEQSPMPIAINLDHGGSNYKDFQPCLEDVMVCIRAGFTSVMIDRSSLAFEENIAQVRKIAEIAHALGVSVEAELGHVGSGDNYENKSDMILTDPSLAKEFISRTGVDCLAVSIGTAHGQYKGVPHLDFERLKEIKEATDHFPLVLHGGSGTGEENLRRACSSGINKVNIGTDLFKAGLKAVRTADLDGGKIYDIWDVIQNAWTDELCNWIAILGSKDKAGLYSNNPYEYSRLVRIKESATSSRFE